MIELGVPAMIHVSGACQHSLDTTSSYYLGADTTAFTQLLFSDVFVDFPDLKLIIPHGGGAVPYHWGGSVVSHRIVALVTLMSGCLAISILTHAFIINVA